MVDLKANVITRSPRNNGIQPLLGAAAAQAQEGVNDATLPARK